MCSVLAPGFACLCHAPFVMPPPPPNHCYCPGWSLLQQNADLNQYWYSPATIAALLDEVRMVGGRAAFVSTPSLYFSLTAAERESSFVFDVR